MATQYPTCAHIVKPIPNIVVNEEIANSIGENFRTLPIFEKGLYEYTYRKYYSVETNELLKCRWNEYKDNFGDRVFAPFQFVDIRDYHFFNCRNRLIPSQSIHTKKDFRFKLKPGPGVDYLGQVPIPQELIMKRGEVTKTKTVLTKEDESKEKGVEDKVEDLNKKNNE